MTTATLPYWRVTREEQAWGDDGGMRGKRRQTDERIPPETGRPGNGAFGAGLAVRAIAPLA